MLLSCHDTGTKGGSNPPNPHFPLTHTHKNPPKPFLSKQSPSIPHPSSGADPAGSSSPGSGTQRAAGGIGTTHPAELSEPSGLGSLLLHLLLGCRGVRCSPSSTSTVRGTRAMLGCPWVKGVSHYRGIRKRKKKLDAEHKEKEVESNSLSQLTPRPIKYSPAPWCGRGNPALPEGRWVPSKSPPGASRSIRGEGGARERG